MLIDWKIILLSVYQIVVILTIIHVVMDNRQPAKTMAWGLVIWFVPVAGIVLYLFFGVNTRKERFISQRSLDQLSKRSMLEFVEQKNLQLPEEHRQLIDMFVNENFSLPFKDSACKIYTDGYAFFPALLSAISKAKDHIHIDMYIIEDDPLGNLVADALIDKARQGVEVKLIYDDVGCWNVNHRFFERMRDEGIEVVAFLPVRFPSFTSKVNYRNHRTGSGVYGLQRAFLVDWYFCDRTLISNRKYYPSVSQSHVAKYPAPHVTQMVTSGPVTPYAEIMQGYVRIILSARRYVYMETPYFLPTEPVLFAMKTAAAAGVDVRVLVPYRSDTKFAEWASRSYLREVLEAGIKVSFYTAGFLHSKLMVSDDNISTCGSTNVDFRSFENNFESNMFFYGKEMAVKMRDIYLEDERQSIAMSDLPERMNPKFLKRLWESLVRMMSPLM